MTITQSEILIIGVAIALVGIIYRNFNKRLDTMEKDIKYILKHLKDKCNECD